MVIRGFEKHMRKNPFTDDEIEGALASIRDHITTILGDGEDTHLSQQA